MATVFFTNVKTSTIFTSLIAQKNNVKSHQLTICKAAANESVKLPNVVLTKRNLAISFTSTILVSIVGNANAAILEADDDIELLEKVKKDRKKRLEKQGAISTAGKETEYLQDLVFKLSKVGQAIEKNDLSAATLVLGRSIDTDWVKKINVALNKLSSSPEEKTEVDAFNSSLSSLISSVTGNDIEASKIAFVASASAFEKWTTLTGLIEQLKGL